MSRTRDKEPESMLDARIARLRKRRARAKLCSRLLLTGLVTYLLFGVVFALGFVKGDSMIPTLRQGDIILLFRLGAMKRYDASGE